MTSKAVILSDKAIRQIILALRAMRCNTQKELRYNQAVVKRIEGQIKRGK